MTEPPATRYSLILRLRDPGDVAAWLEFVTLYEPLILRLAGRKGRSQVSCPSLRWRLAERADEADRRATGALLATSARSAPAAHPPVRRRGESRRPATSNSRGLRLRMARRVMSFLVGGWLLLIQALSAVFGDARERDGPYERPFLFVGPCQGTLGIPRFRPGAHDPVQPPRRCTHLSVVPEQI